MRKSSHLKTETLQIIVCTKIYSERCSPLAVVWEKNGRRHPLVRGETVPIIMHRMENIPVHICDKAQVKGSVSQMR